ncbi:MAG: guanylate kinase [Desulfobacterales bacterium]|nr:guanylate kinase [Desulfobacterales bacterium]MBF0396153.1 guanylate kinase [Desulfobacterales bacterium]
MESNSKGQLFIVSAPSGTGKTTLCKMLLERFPNLIFSVSYTTREPRNGEINSVDYNFISKDDFICGIKKQQWAEWAEVHGNYYGTCYDFLNKALNLKHNILLDIDVQGTKQVLEIFKNSITIFIKPPSIDVLRERLLKRKTDSMEIIEKRIINAQNEMAQSSIYKYIVINDNLSIAFNELVAIFEKHSVKS